MTNKSLSISSKLRYIEAGFLEVVHYECKALDRSGGFRRNSQHILLVQASGRCHRFPSGDSDDALLAMGCDQTAKRDIEMKMRIVSSRNSLPFSSSIGPASPNSWVEK